MEGAGWPQSGWGHYRRDEQLLHVSMSAGNFRVLRIFNTL